MLFISFAYRLEYGRRRVNVAFRSSRRLDRAAPAPALHDWLLPDAMLFILFDIEIVFLYPLAVILHQLAWFGFVELAVFVGLLAVAYVYVCGKERWSGIAR